MCVTSMHVCLGFDFCSDMQNHASLQEMDKKTKIIKTKRSCECVSITAQYVIFITLLIFICIFFTGCVFTSMCTNWHIENVLSSCLCHYSVFVCVGMCVFSTL